MALIKRRVIGKGTYGTVFLAESTDPDVPPIAVKSCLLHRSSSLRLEDRILTQLRGLPGIVQSFGSTTSIKNGAHYYDLLLEYAAGGTLADVIRKGKKGLQEGDVRRYTRMILRGLCSMHSFGMVHCDLKPSNILVFPGAGGVNNNELKIADFGLVKEHGICKDDNNFWKFRFRGTPFYVSPESLAHGEIETPMDIWSLGCIVVEMVTGTPAWWQCLDQETLMFRLAILHETPRIPENLSEDGKDFLRKCFARDPTERWTAQTLLDHPFVLDQVSAPQLSSGSPLDLHAPSFLHRSLGYSDGLPPPGWASFSSHNSLGSSASLTQPKCCSFSFLNAHSDLATKKSLDFHNPLTPPDWILSFLDAPPDLATKKSLDFHYPLTPPDWISLSFLDSPVDSVASKNSLGVLLVTPPDWCSFNFFPGFFQGFGNNCW